MKTIYIPIFPITQQEQNILDVLLSQNFLMLGSRLFAQSPEYKFLILTCDENIVTFAKSHGIKSVLLAPPTEKTTGWFIKHLPHEDQPQKQFAIVDYRSVLIQGQDLEASMNLANNYGTMVTSVSIPTDHPVQFFTPLDTVNFEVFIKQTPPGKHPLPGQTEILASKPFYLNWEQETYSQERGYYRHTKPLPFMRWQHVPSPSHEALHTCENCWMWRAKGSYGSRLIPRDQTVHLNGHTPLLPFYHLPAESHFLLLQDSATNKILVYADKLSYKRCKISIFAAVGKSFSPDPLIETWLGIEEPPRPNPLTLLGRQYVGPLLSFDLADSDGVIILMQQIAEGKGATDINSVEFDGQPWILSGGQDNKPLDSYGNEFFGRQAFPNVYEANGSILAFNDLSELSFQTFDNAKGYPIPPERCLIVRDDVDLLRLEVVCKTALSGR